MNLELEVKKALESKGFHVIKKGKGFDLLALKGDLVLVIECKDWNREIGGKTLRKIVRKLKREYRKILSDRLFRGKTVIPILISRGGIRSYRTEPALVFSFREFVEEFFDLDA